MATPPATPADQRAEAREFLRSVHERNARSREEVQRRVASLRQIAETLRTRRRP